MGIVQRWKSLRLGTKLSLVTASGLLVIFAVSIALVSFTISQVMEREATREMAAKTELLVDLIESSDRDLRKQIAYTAGSFQRSLKGTFDLSAETIDINGKPSPALKLDGQAINLNFDVVDRFTDSTGAVATVFAKSGEDFMRVTTSLKTDKGDRAIGTTLDRAHPGYKAVLDGRTYTGIATLFGRRYMTQYDPIRSAAGAVVGVSFVGLDFTSYVAELNATIRKLKVGQTGYFFVIDARPGANLGKALVHPTSEGSSLLDERDAKGQAYVKDMLERKNGVIRFPVVETAVGEGSQGDKILAFASVPNWQILIAGGSFVDEFTQEARSLIQSIVIAAALLLVAVALAFKSLVSRLISAPLLRATAAAKALAQSDLTVQLQTDRQDEIGELMKAMNQIGGGIATVVTHVREGAEAVATASAEIAEGNQDLSGRTEQQASALEQTSSLMGGLHTTVQQNADNARQANQLAQEASVVAAQGGEVVSQVVDTMKGINDSSRKIADIISVIDGIAFQTNILALNAAVEAARAGEQGRGFAVVATEVRSLAGRSAAAAKEIKSLIQASVERVEHGTALVDRAGATMGAVVQSIQRVTTIMGEISSASAGQSAGVAQVGAAVSQMDQATQQNAALVEQMAAAASSLRSQADELVQEVSVFKLAHA